MKTTKIGNIEITFPENLVFSRGNNYIKITGLSAKGRKVRFGIFDHESTAPVVEIVRYADKNGVCILPLDGVFQSLFNKQRPGTQLWPYNNTDIDVRRSILVNIDNNENLSTDIGNFTIINGAGGEILKTTDKGGYPDQNPRKLIFYPQFIGGEIGNPQYFNFISGQITNDIYISVQFDGSANYTWVNEINSRFNAIPGMCYSYIDFDLKWFTKSVGGTVQLTAALTNNTRYVIATIEGEVDNCTDGIFTRWRDRYGLLRYYRWSQEKEVESAEATETYRLLDENLVPYECSSRSRKRKFTLHSRLVDALTLDICKTIIDGRDIQYFDIEQVDWIDCYIDATDVEDNGKNYQNMVVELYTQELTI